MFCTGEVRLEGLHTGNTDVADLAGEIHLCAGGHFLVIVQSVSVFHHVLEPRILHYQRIHF